MTNFHGGQLWTLDDKGDHWRYVQDGKPALAGRLNHENGKAVTFRGTEWHGTEPYSGDRVVCVSYVPRNWMTLDDDNFDKLGDLGFRVPCKPRASACQSDTAQEETDFEHGSCIPITNDSDQRQLEVQNFMA